MPAGIDLALITPTQYDFPMTLSDHIHAAAKSGRPLIMGIINATPDSFSDGGQFDRPELALQHAEQMVKAGVDILDIGGESTRPGAEPVAEAQELARVIPIIEILRQRLDTPISIDTMKPGVMQAAVEAGARMINDVNGLRQEHALETAADLQVPVCVMHMQGDPITMQQQPRYRSVVDEVMDFFQTRMQQCNAAGIQAEHLILDPGFGFGKTLQHNLELLAALPKLAKLAPLLVGISRKSMLGTITGRQQANDRVAASIAAAVLAADRGAAIVRVHDVQETVDALRVRTALKAVEESD